MDAVDGLPAVALPAVARAGVRSCSRAACGAYEHNRTTVPISNREYAIKAAYLYQFSRYVQWPADAFANDRSPLVIGVLGTDPFGGILEEIARTKRIEGRPIVVRRFASMAEYTPCHILFVSSSVGPEQRAAAIQKSATVPAVAGGRRARLRRARRHGQFLPGRE